MLKWLNEYSDAITALSAIVMVIVTAVYAFFTILLWKATRRQAEAAHAQASLARQQSELTREIFEATHRPELSVEPVIKQAAHPGMVRVNFKVVNHGRMTAIVTQWSAALRTGTTPIGEAEPLAGTVAVFPGASVETWPHVEVDGVFAPMLWKAQGAQVMLHMTVRYRGASAVPMYKTEIRGSFRMTEPWAYTLQQVEHDIT
jgi:hypothetical protein